MNSQTQVASTLLLENYKRRINNFGHYRQMIVAIILVKYITNVMSMSRGVT